MTRIEGHLAANPEDGRGWEVVAPVYLRAGRIDDAVKAYDRALRLLGESAARLSNYGEALVTRSDGAVSAEARAALRAGPAARRGDAEAALLSRPRRRAGRQP